MNKKRVLDLVYIRPVPVMVVYKDSFDGEINGEWGEKTFESVNFQSPGIA